MPIKIGSVRGVTFKVVILILRPVGLLRFPIVEIGT